MKVLIIDNNPSFLSVFAKLLEIKGFDVTAETELKAGLNHIESKSYPVVFVDAPLDNFTEKQILKSLKRTPIFKNSNVFLFSSVDFNDGELNEWRKAGLYSYLKKPVKRGVIIQALDDVREKINNTWQVSSGSEQEDEEATPEQLQKLDDLQKQIQELESKVKAQQEEASEAARQAQQEEASEAARQAQQEEASEAARQAQQEEASEAARQAQQEEASEAARQAAASRRRLKPVEEVAASRRRLKLHDKFSKKRRLKLHDKLSKRRRLKLHDKLSKRRRLKLHDKLSKRRRLKLHDKLSKRTRKLLQNNCKN